jgi:hypothetical protein
LLAWGWGWCVVVVLMELWRPVADRWAGARWSVSRRVPSRCRYIYSSRIGGAPAGSEVGG